MIRLIAFICCAINIVLPIIMWEANPIINALGWSYVFFLMFVSTDRSK